MKTSITPHRDTLAMFLGRTLLMVTAAYLVPVLPVLHLSPLPGMVGIPVLGAFAALVIAELYHQLMPGSVLTIEKTDEDATELLDELERRTLELQNAQFFFSEASRIFQTLEQAPQLTPEDLAEAEALAHQYQTAVHRYYQHAIASNRGDRKNH